LKAHKFLHLMSGFSYFSFQFMNIFKLYARARARVCVRMNIYLCLCMYVCCMYVCMYLNYVCIGVCMFACMDTCVCVCVSEYGSGSYSRDTNYCSKVLLRHTLVYCSTDGRQIFRSVQETQRQCAMRCRMAILPNIWT
jgi:hypothetical protein